MKPVRSGRWTILANFSSHAAVVALALTACLLFSCSKPPVQTKTVYSPPSDIKVEVHAGGPVVVTTKTAEFQLLPSGSLQATLLKDGRRLTLDDTGSSAASDEMTRACQPVQFTPDFAQAKILEATGKLGRGKGGVILAHSMPPGSAIDRELVIEAYDAFPNIPVVGAKKKKKGGE